MGPGCGRRTFAEDIRSCVDGNPAQRLFPAEELERAIERPARSPQAAGRMVASRSGSIGVVLSIVLIATLHFSAVSIRWSNGAMATGRQCVSSQHTTTNS